MSILQHPKPPASRQQLDELVRHCGRGALPSAYLTFLSRHNGGYSPDAAIFLPDGTSADTLLFLSAGLSSADEDIFKTWRRLQARLRPGLMPVVRDGDGGAFCIRLSASSPGSIWFWHPDNAQAARTHASWGELIAAVRLETLSV